MKEGDKYLYHLVVEFDDYDKNRKRSYCIALEERINHMNYNSLKQEIKKIYDKELHNDIGIEHIIIIDIKELPLLIEDLL